MTNLPLFPDTPHHLTVSELTEQVRLLIDRHQDFQDLWVEGEISNFTHHKSGHLYFTLKDSRAQLKCVMFRSQASRLQFSPASGAQVQVHGRLGVYEQRGEYQLYADAMQPAGMGDLYQQFEQLKAKLAAEGVFDAENKKPLPLLPRSIGVVTSATAAAFQDVLNVLKRRYPLAHVILSPSLVQGETASPKIIAALDRLNKRDDIDVILLVRGGGSLEDLWCFNDERLARTVADSRLPVISGVGHEIDFTLVDFAADHRAPTPSAAAEVVVPDISGIRLQIERSERQLLQIIQGRLADSVRQIESYHRSLRHLSPESTVHSHMQRVDELQERLQRRMKSLTSEHRQRIQSLQNSLKASSPQAVLARGYAIVTRAGDGKQISDAIEAAPGTTLNIQLKKGTLITTVRDRKLADEQ